MRQRQTKKKIGGVRFGTKRNISKSVHLQNKKYIGGLRLGIKEDGTEYTAKEAFNFFLKNIKQSEILTDSSLSSVTLVLTIKDDDIESFPYPYYSTRPDTFDQPLTKILLKVLVSSVKEGTPLHEYENTYYFYRRGIKLFKITSNESLNTEVTIQKNIYMRSFRDEQNMLDPICPAILYHVGELKPRKKNILSNLILRKLRSTDPIYTTEDKKNLIDLFSNGISLICMEYLDGYSTIENYPTDEDIKYFTLYELLKMYEYGYIHSDLHASNG